MNFVLLERGVPRNTASQKRFWNAYLRARTEAFSRSRRPPIPLFTDEHEDTSAHLIAVKEGRVVGGTRLGNIDRAFERWDAKNYWLSLGVPAEKTMLLSRVFVSKNLSAYDRRQLFLELMRRTLRLAKNNGKTHAIIAVEAGIPLVKRWSELGFKNTGTTFFHEGRYYVLTAKVKKILSKL